MIASAPVQWAAPSRPPWQTALLGAAAILEASPRGQLNLAVLISLQRLLVPATNPYRSQVREQAAVIRLNGLVQQELPGAVEARLMVAESLRSLEAAIASGATTSDPVGTASEIAFLLMQAHPFMDGNGRVARAVGNWLLLRAGYRLKSDPQDYCRRRKPAYYHALVVRQGLAGHSVDQDCWGVFFADLVAECYEAPVNFDATNVERPIDSDC